MFKNAVTEGAHHAPEADPPSRGEPILGSVMGWPLAPLNCRSLFLLFYWISGPFFADNFCSVGHPTLDVGRAQAEAPALPIHKQAAQSGPQNCRQVPEQC